MVRAHRPTIAYLYQLTYMITAALTHVYWPAGMSMARCVQPATAVSGM